MLPSFHVSRSTTVVKSGLRVPPAVDLLRNLQDSARLYMIAYDCMLHRPSGKVESRNLPEQPLMKLRCTPRPATGRQVEAPSAANLYGMFSMIEAFSTALQPHFHEGQ